MRTHPTLGRTLVLGAVVLLAASACGSGSSDTDSAGASTADDGTKQVNVYGADGNMNNGLGEDFADSPARWPACAAPCSSPTSARSSGSGCSASTPR
ncbi:hypothetical protein ACFQX8_22645 [Klenkia terrae]|uniref:hypothetical protein n=1 Tax=Klenkia terrae TaxID=1052259 RepID=UPI003609C69D